MTNRNRISTIIITTLAAAVMLLAGSSCYTIVRHPRIAQANHQRPENNRCFDCHTENEVYSFHHPVNISRPPIGWDDGHYAPWWYDVYWSDEDVTSSQYRDTFRPGGSKTVGNDGQIRAFKPITGDSPPPSVKVDEVREKEPTKREKDETRAADKRKLRPKKKKQKDE